MCPMMCRAIFARRFPLPMSSSSCVSRMRTKASSAATKKALNKTNATTASIFQPSSMSAFQFILQTHLAENRLEHVLQRDDADFTPFTVQHDREALPAPLHPAQRHFH